MSCKLSRFLEKFESRWELDVEVKDMFQTLIMKIILLEDFFMEESKWDIYDEGLRIHVGKIRQVVDDTTESIVTSRGKFWTFPEKLCCRVAEIIRKLDDMTKPHIGQIYATVSKSRRSSTWSEMDYVVDRNQKLLKHTENLFGQVAHSFRPLSKEMEVLGENLLYLLALLKYSKPECSECEILQSLVRHAETVTDKAASVTDKAACLLYLCYKEKKMDDNVVNEMMDEICCIVQEIKPFQPSVREMYMKALKASDSSLHGSILADEPVLLFLHVLLGHMIDLSKENASFKKSAMDQVHALHEELQIIRNYLFDPSASNYCQSNERVNCLLLHIKIVLFHTAYAIYPSYDSDITEQMAGKLNLTIYALLQEIEVIKKEVGEIFEDITAKSLRSSFPETNELGFMDFVIQNLNELLNSKVDSILQLQHQLGIVLGSILSLREEFFGIGELFQEREELRDPWLRFKDIVYQTEFVVDSFIARTGHLWEWKLWLFDILQQIKTISREVSSIKINWTTDTAISKFPVHLGLSSPLDNSRNFSAVWSPNHEAGNESKKPIGLNLFVEETKMIKEQLTNGLTQLCVLSIVGMPGIGKTTLGDSIYEDPLIPLCFHAHARCHVSHVYQKQRLLLEILKQVHGITDQACTIEDDDLDKMLYQNLKGKKYFIFLDDVWDMRPWNDLRSSFPDDKMGSRIMFTSRFRDVALDTGLKSVTYPLNPISDSMTWELLQLKLFRKENCPRELVKVGQDIAAKCKGLTLAVDLIAGLLKTIPRKRECWAQVATGLNRHLLEDHDGQCMHILELSYKQLPDHLKPCFLYLGAFPGNRYLPTNKLILLWIAEGFVQLQKGDKGNSEDTARIYLNDLIVRSLVIDAKRGSSNGVKAIRVHDLLHEFALAKAKEECFLQQHTCPDSEDSSSHAQTMYEPYRLCVYSSCCCFEASKSFGSRLRSLVSTDFPHSCPFENIKLLRVLDLSGIHTRSFTPCIFQLVRLRYLSIRTSSKCMPREISNLQKLETLLVRSYESMQLTNNIWTLVRLRHLKIEGSCSLPRFDQEFMEKFFKCNSLQTLSAPCLYFHPDILKTLRALPNLRKLSCRFLDSHGHSSKFNQFPVLDFLTRLESLSVVYNGQLYCYCKFSFPGTLKKLKLSKFRFSRTTISAIGKLPNLEVLKLSNASFKGKTWNMEDGEFLNLKFLKLEFLDIVHWNASEDNLPCLETLVVRNCRQLVEIPPCFGDIPTLKRIELQNCIFSACASTQTVKAQQEEMGNDQIVVIIK